MTASVAAPRARRRTVLELLASTDHKSVGLATAVTAFAFFLAGGVLAVLIRIELAKPGMQLVGEDAYNQLFTIHGSTMFFLFAVPVVMGVGLYLVPLQIGAADVEWPRAALFAYWIYLFGGLTMYAGFLTDLGAAKFGWTAYYPLSDSNSSPGAGVDFWIVAVALSTSAAVIQSACLLATVVRRRAPGMTMLRMPLFTWSEVVSVLMVLASFPVLVVAMVLLFLDRHVGTVFGLPGGALTYQHLFWFYGHPLVYVVFFPLVGAVGEVIATFSRRRFFGYSVTVLSLLVFAALSMSVWGHHMFVTQAVENRYFSLTSTALAVPAGIEYFAFVATMWGGRIRLATPMLFALGFVLLFLIGGLTGIFVGSPPLDYHVHDSYVVVGHFHYTLFGGTVFGLFAAIYYWFPKVTGKRLGERLGRWHCGLMFVGALLAFIPMFFLGHEGMARRVANYPSFRDWGKLNLLATIGALTILVSILLFLVNVARSLRRCQRVAPDPWAGQTLEWWTSSPPPRHNFESLPPVRTYAPLLDVRTDRERAA